MKVLIAEDNALWRKLLERNVTSWDYKPVLTENGREAWEILQRDDAPRLAILDWQMPEMDGIEVCRRVKRDENLPFTYVIILTSRDAKEDMVAGLDAGADDYLTKPVEAVVLRSRLAAAKRIVEVVPPKEWARPRVPGYEVEQLLGKGAFATVWRATHEESQRTVALKIIRVDLAADQVFDRFAREIQLMQKMDHPNIAEIYDSRIDKQLGYYAMELVEGTTLDEYVREQKPKAARILELTAQIADALDHTHQQGIVHRDLKPSNIMVTSDAEPKLVDFGLAKSMFVADAEQQTGQTLDGTVIGTPMFMAPEQARGDNENLDGRTDVYALGIILYVMILRKHPHKVNRKDRWATIREIAQGDVCLPSEVLPKFNRDLEAIMMKALAEEPRERYETAAKFAEALRAFLAERITALRDAATEVEDK